MRSVASLPDRLRQPEYTGENRCWPCTMVNTAIAVGVAAAVLAGGLLAGLGGLATVVAAGLVLAAALSAIWLRGYLVPGTPTLTKQYVPERVLAWFDKAPEPAGPEPAPEPEEDVDVHRVLVGSGVLVECENRDDLCAEGTFRTTWRERIEELREGELGPDLLRDYLPDEVGDVTFHERGDAVVARQDGLHVGQWESKAALLADAAAADVLPEHVDDWEALSFHAQAQLVGGLRLFLESCPDCDGRIAFGEETVESCCRSFDVVAMTCEDCDARLFETEATEEMTAAEA